MRENPWFSSTKPWGLKGGSSPITRACGGCTRARDSRVRLSLAFFFDPCILMYSHARRYMHQSMYKGQIYVHKGRGVRSLVLGVQNTLGIVGWGTRNSQAPSLHRTRQKSLHAAAHTLTVSYHWVSVPYAKIRNCFASMDTQRCVCQFVGQKRLRFLFQCILLCGNDAPNAYVDVKREKLSPHIFISRNSHFARETSILYNSVFIPSTQTWDIYGRTSQREIRWIFLKITFATLAQFSPLSKFYNFLKRPFVLEEKPGEKKKQLSLASP